MLNWNWKPVSSLREGEESERRRNKKHKKTQKTSPNHPLLYICFLPLLLLSLPPYLVRRTWLCNSCFTRSVSVSLNRSWSHDSKRAIQEAGNDITISPVTLKTQLFVSFPLKMALQVSWNATASGTTAGEGCCREEGAKGGFAVGCEVGGEKVTVAGGWAGEDRTVDGGTGDVVAEVGAWADIWAHASGEIACSTQEGLDPLRRDERRGLGRGGVRATRSADCGSGLVAGVLETEE